MSEEPDTPLRVVRSAEDLGAALRAHRDAAGLSQSELAEWAGVNRQYVVQIEGGDVSLQVRRILDLFAVLGADLAVLPREGR